VEESTNSQQTPKQQLTTELKEKPEYVLTKEIYKDAKEEIYGTVEYNYDEQDNLLRITSKDEKGEVIGDREYKYNEDGLLIERRVYKVVNYMAYSWISSSKAWNRVRVVQEFPMYNDSIAKYHYNNDSQLIKYDERDKEGKELRRIEIKYYRNGKKKYEHEQRSSGYEEKLYYNKDGNWKKRIERRDSKEKIREAKYDEDGRRIKTTEITKNDKGDIIDSSTNKSKYNQEGKLIKFVGKSEGSILGYFEHSFEYKYDKKGNNIEIIYKDENSNIKKIEEFRYDEKGNQIKYIHKNSDGSISHSYISIYDNDNNFIKGYSKGKDGQILKVKECHYKRIR